MSGIARAIFGALMLVSVSATPAAAQYWQCAPYARLISGIQLFGNAASWWAQAASRYARGAAPEVGAVLSFKSTQKMRAGHVAMVSKVIDARTIKVNHANWSVIGGSRGKVEQDATVIDVSPRGDWSQVRVWYASIGGIGTTAYPTNGFIYKSESSSPKLAFNTTGLLAE